MLLVYWTLLVIQISTFNECLFRLEEKGISHRKESRIFHMRNFNNWIKSMLIQEFVDRILKSKENEEDKRFNVSVFFL